jgi:chaperonin GroES
MSDVNQSGIIPTGGHLLVLPDKVEERTAGGLYIPDTTREKEQQAATVGRLIAVGASAWKDLDDGSAWANVGDRISYARYAGVSMKGVDGESYILINDNDVLAVLSF